MAMPAEAGISTARLFSPTLPVHRPTISTSSDEEGDDKLGFCKAGHATPVAAANSERERTVHEANVFATNTLAAADAQVTAVQTSYNTAQSNLNTLYQENASHQEQLKSFQRQFDEIVADRTKLIETHHIQLTNKAQEITNLTNSLNQSRAETNDFRNRIQTLNEQLDNCNAHITNLTGKVNSLRQTVSVAL